MIDQIQITYRHLQHVTLSGLASINIVVGPNNAGKTSLFRGIHAFSQNHAGVGSGDLAICTHIRSPFVSRGNTVRFSAFWSRINANNSRIEYWCDESGRRAIQFDGSGNAKFSWMDNSRKFDAWEKFTQAKFDSEAMRPLRDELANEHTAWFRSSFFLWHRRKSTYSEPAGRSYPQLDGDAEHLAGRLENLLLTSKGEVIRRRIDRFMNSVVPGVGKIGFSRTDAQGGSLISIVFDDGHSERSLLELGGGVEQTLALALVLLGEPSLGAVFIEEPESHLHESAQRRLIEQIREHHGERQVFIATHSPVFVNEFEGSNVYRITRDLGTGHATVHACLSRPMQRKILDELGVLPSSLTQTNCVVWVEGPTEVRLVEFWLKVLAPELRVNQHYVLAQTGGSNILGLAADVEEGANAWLQDITRVCRHNFFICDRDAGVEEEPSKEPVRKIEELVGRDFWITRGYEIEWYFPQTLVGALWGEGVAAHMAKCAAADKPFYDHMKASGIKGTATADARKVRNAERAIEETEDWQVWFSGEMGEDLRENVGRLAEFIRSANQLMASSVPNCDRCGQPMPEKPAAKQPARLSSTRVDE